MKKKKGNLAELMQYAGKAKLQFNGWMAVVFALALYQSGNIVIL